jgi:hypothetical protein
MAKSFQERQADRIDRFVATLTRESEFFGLLGKGYPGSFYKVYVRPLKTSRQWWRFEVGAGASSVDPIKEQARIDVAARAAAVWAPLPFLVDYTHDPNKASIAKLLARAKELAGEVA